jgi:hypothetical protein
MAALAATVVAVLAILGMQVGGTYALWSTTRTVPGSTIQAGSTGLAVNGSAAAVLTGLDVTKLGPGGAIATSLTVSNTGTTALLVAVTGGTVTADSGGLAAELMVRLVAASPASCTPSLMSGFAGRIPGYVTTASPTMIAAGASVPYCLVVTLDADAPPTTQNRSTAFTLTLTGQQVAP